MKSAKNNRQETFFTLTGTCTHKNEKTEQINLQQYYYILFAIHVYIIYIIQIIITLT